MKKKFILMTTVAVMLIAMLCAFAVPVMTPAPASAANETIAEAETADLVVMSSEVLIIDNSAPAPAPMGATGEAPVWLTPETAQWPKLAGGPNKFI